MYTNFLEFAELWGCSSFIRTKDGTQHTMYNLFNLDKIGYGCEELVWRELSPMIEEAYRRSMTDTWFHDAVRHRMFNSDVLSVCFAGNDPVAVIASDSVKTPFGRVMYSAMTGTRVDQQKKGWMSAMKAELIKNCRFIVGRTQNPVVLRATANQFGAVAPIDGVDAETMFVAKYMANMHASEMDERFVCRGVYEGRPLYDRPFFTGDRFSEFLSEVIDASNGDAVMFVARNPNAYIKPLAMAA